MCAVFGPPDARRTNEATWGGPSDSAFGHWALFYVPTNALTASVARGD
jgi:hypothetical protein